MKHAAPPPPYPQLDPLDGMVKRHNHLRIGQYHQHLTELLPEDMSPLEVGWLAGCWWWAQVAGGGGYRGSQCGTLMLRQLVQQPSCLWSVLPTSSLFLGCLLFALFSAVLPQGVWPRSRGGEDALCHWTFWHHWAAAGAPLLCDHLPCSCMLLAARLLALPAAGMYRCITSRHPCSCPSLLS